jgi:hypothetical protein
MNRPVRTEAPREGQYIPKDRTPGATDKLKRLRALAWLLDNSIPLPGGFRIGLDPILGLIPGLGDALGAVLALYIIYEARQLGASRMLVLKMIGNMLIDALIGTIPILGDLFDAGFKANVRNVAMLEKEIDKRG